MSGLISGLFGGAKTPKMPEPPPTVNHSGAQTAADEQRRRVAAASGRAATMLTQGQLGSANIGTRSLLGN